MTLDYDPDCIAAVYSLTPWLQLPSNSHTTLNLTLFGQVYGKLGGPEVAVGRSLGVTEAVMVGLVTGRPLSRQLKAVLSRFYLSLVLFDLWNASPIHEGENRTYQQE